MKKIVLHACCAPCASYPIQKLAQDGFEPVVFFYNPNIFPFKEYEIRKLELQKYSEKLGLEFFSYDYEIKKFYETISGLEHEPERGLRCEKCFYLRLQKASEFAKEKGIDCFTTTLTVSPHKNSSQIFEVGKIIQKETGVEFLEYNFKKQNGFLISRQIAKENNMYAQSYCGCEFSIRKD